MKSTTFKNLFTPKPHNFYENDWKEKAKEFEQHCFDKRNKFISALKHPTQAQKDVLVDIISVTKDSEFGQSHNMHQIKTPDEFKRNIPIRTYDQLMPWINKEIESKGGILSTSPVVRWLKTSGTTGEPKKIPYTKHWMENYRVPGMSALWATYMHYSSDLLLHPYAVLYIRA